MTRIFPLLDLSTSRLDAARQATDLRSSVSLHEGHDCVLRQTVAALLSGARMELCHPPDEAWILVLDGRVSITPADQADAQHAVTGDLVQLPPQAHVVSAEQDSVILLTVAKGERPVEPAPKAAELSPEASVLAGNADFEHHRRTGVAP